MGKVVVYTKDDCIWCTRAKALLTAKNIAFTAIHMPDDISRDDLLEKFPAARTMPIITIDDVWIGGFDKLNEKVKNNELLPGQSD